MSSDDFESFKISIKNKIGLDLNCYKEKQLKRRIIQFMARYKCADFSLFYSLLEADPELLEKFRNFLTINTSEFFRDIKVYNYLQEQIFNRFGSKLELKVWSAGCSIGAEPYSLAILAEEAGIGKYGILATDLDVLALDKAKIGAYPANLLKNIPAGLVRKYFRDTENGFAIRDELKRNITFKLQNLLTDTFAGGFDIILCRNVFIYFTQAAQEELIRRFLGSLKGDGYFIIGSSEFIYSPERYGCVKLAPSIYQKKSNIA